MKIIKSDGSEATFSKSNIISAITNANMRVRIEDRFTAEEIKQIAKDVEDKCKAEIHIMSSSDIQNFVEKAIMAAGKYEVATTYITYRYQEKLDQRKNTIDETVLALIDNFNEELKQENANKNPTIINVQRDYMAGEVSKDISRRYIIPEDIYKAHKEGIIHFHDMDYFANRIHNCLDKSTKFITYEGVKSFEDFKDGDETLVLTKENNWKKATVRYFGKDKLYKFTFNNTQEVLATEDHRWYLNDGTVTTSLKIGDKLAKAPKINNQINSVEYIVTNKEYAKVDEVWCLEVEDEHNFVLHNGIVTGNCDLWNAEDMLQNGTVLCGVKIDKPHRFSVAATIASQIAQQVSSSQYGGQSLYVSHLSPFVEETRKSLRKRYIEQGLDENAENFDEIIEKATEMDVEDGIQTLMFQLNSLQGTNGQAPFITLFMYLDDVPAGKERDDLALVIKKIFEQRILGMKNKEGIYVSPAFPKLIYVLDEDNIHPDSEYYWLTRLAAECTAHRMVPDYISAKVMKKLKDGNVYSSMGCRSFLTPAYVDKNDPWKITTKRKGVPKFCGRFNQGVVTINLPDVALSSKKDMEKFWYILDERLELCHRALRLRHERLRGVKSDIAPILWQNGALARLKPGETIDKLLYNGYSTISLGYVGLYETVKYMTDKDHWLSEEDGGALEFAKQVMQRLNDKCKQWKEIEHIDYSVYGTPEESTTYKFAQCLQKRFGIIKGITDKNYVTNSYHIPVFVDINAFDKIKLESPLQALSPGGSISYLEAPNMINNVEAIEKLLQYFYENIMYAEINLKLDTCEECGYQGAFDIKEIDGKLQFVCPQCGEKEFDHVPTRLRPTRRVCGYISSNQVNQGRMAEYAERVEHI